MKIPEFSCEPANEEEWNQLADACEAVGVGANECRETERKFFSPKNGWKWFKFRDGKYLTGLTPLNNHITVPEALKLLRPEEKTFEPFSVDISGETVERLELMESLFGSWVWFDRLTNEEMLSNGFLSFQISGKVFSNSSHYGPEITFNEALYRLGHDFDEGFELGEEVTIYGGDSPFRGVIKEWHKRPWECLPVMHSVSGMTYTFDRGTYRIAKCIPETAEVNEPAAKTFREFKVNVEGNPKALEALKEAALTKGYRRIDDHEGRALQFACYEHGVSRAIGVDGSASETLSINEALIYLRGYGFHKYEIGQRFRDLEHNVFEIIETVSSVGANGRVGYKIRFTNSGNEQFISESIITKYFTLVELSKETPSTPKEEEVKHELKVGDEVIVVASTFGQSSETRALIGEKVTVRHIHNDCTWVETSGEKIWSFDHSDLEPVKSTEETITPEPQGDVMSEEKKKSRTRRLAGYVIGRAMAPLSTAKKWSGKVTGWGVTSVVWASIAVAIAASAGWIDPSVVMDMIPRPEITWK